MNGDMVGPWAPFDTVGGVDDDVAGSLASDDAVGGWARVCNPRAI